MPGYPIKPTFATNKADGSENVAGAIDAHLEWLDETWAKPFSLAIASAYVNPGGFALLASALERAATVRLLIGAEPEPAVARIRRLDRTEPPAERALEAHSASMEEDRNLLGFTRDADASAKKFIAWLSGGTVEVKRFTDGFLHGKAYLVDTDDEAVVAGSSNFTFSGLARNHELNLGHYDPHTVALVREWFDEMWAASEDFDLAGVYASRFEPHDPYLIYLRMLWERYGEEVAALEAAAGFGLHLAGFQRDGVTMAKMILARYGGVVVADGVGLGKTYVAGELIREAVEERRQRVLVVAPAALRDGPWRAFHANAPFNFEVVSYDQLSADKQLNPDDPEATNHLRHPIGDYALVVVDEAHAYRNPSTLRSAALSRLLEGSPPKALVLLTATPVNNGLFDLYNILALFVRNDATFAAAGIPSLRQRFSEAAKVDPELLDPDQLFDVLSPVVVRRTRSYVKHYYPGEEIVIGGVRQRISFPAAEVLPVRYRLEDAMPGFLARFAAAIAPPEDVPDDETLVNAQSARRAAGAEILVLARYAPSAYRLDGEFALYEGQVAGLLRSSLLKRFESSAKAFGHTCETMAASHDQFLLLLDSGWVATGDALKQLSTSDSDEIDDLIADAGDRWNTAPASEYDVDRLRADVEADRDLLLAWAAEAHEVTADNDPKLAALRETLAGIAAAAVADVGEPSTEGDRRKTIVFSYYTDTVEWIRAYLEEAVVSDPRLAVYADRVVSVNGSDHDSHQTRAMFGFAPTTTQAPTADDLFDIMVATDVLAEGVNLQQARAIVNYDLPWNPMRLVQRHGRIDRIGSPHARVYMYCFMPDADLEALLHLEDRLHTKISQAAKSIGVESTIIPGSKVSDRSYSETRETLANIAAGDAAFLDETGGGATAEEFRQQLRRGLDNPWLKERVLGLAWGSGSGKAVVGAQPGFVFCARVGDHQAVQFRYVSMAEPAEPVVVRDVLACLTQAEATRETERVLDDDTYQLAYDAWAAARADILTTWTFATDPRNLQPDVPKAMRDAVAHLQTYAPEGMEQVDVDRLIDTLNAPYPERILRQAREVLGDDAAGPYEKSALLADLATRNALTPQEPPEPLPVAAEDDIHLVCWMAITPPSAGAQN